MTTTSTSTTTSTTTTTSTSTTTFTSPHFIGFAEGYESTSSSSTTTTTQPSYAYEWGIPRKAGLDYPEDEKVDAVLPTASKTDLDPFSMKTFVDFDGNVLVVDGAGANFIDDGQNIFALDELAPQHVASVSSTTSTTTSSTSTTTPPPTTTSTTTTIPWFVPETLTPTVGGIDSGELSDAWTDDDNLLVLSEVSGPTGFSYSFEFGGGGDAVPTGYVKVTVKGWYEGNPGHNVKIAVWNFGSMDWDDLTAAGDDFPSAASEQTYLFQTPNPAENYVQAGLMHLRIQHDTAGSAAHDFSIDQINLSTRTTTSTTTT